jgi:hypothetical protein
MVMNMMHGVMMHTTTTTFGLHGNRLGAIRSGLRISSGLLGTRRGSLRCGSRLLRRVGRGFSALRRGGGLRGRSLGLLRGVLPGASRKQRQSQCSPGKRD